ncbi:MarR family winged helix-turn-helix transcriptional regulator [Haloarcula sp. S1AR25-5A]|uniref:MarR family winged helix-turn-helix transcriptional regulator n=1 Tax=Haloarcula terrestris TaxID=2950533 RepID=A0AAE4EVE3_9EURY|nr:MarR family winged helix-turn-helix transcriptional regulator [Haloarcula terrestris]MDS0220870.1 MarR family winged helix-turn-helix transcriptional regulator [Haloarcula terrestris]
MPGLQVAPTVADCSPSAKLVYLVLSEDAPMTHAQLRSRTALSSTTLRSALDPLEEIGLVETRPAEDARSRVYVLAEG